MSVSSNDGGWGGVELVVVSGGPFNGSLCE